MMKKAISLLLLTVLALTLITGGKKKTEVPMSAIKEQEQVITTADKGRNNSVLLSEYEVPDRFTGEWSGMNGCILVHADADVELPNADKIPTGSISRRDFTQEDADTLMRVLLKGSTLYEELGMTKQQVLERLEQYQAMQRGEIPLEGDSVTYETLPEVIERWTEYARTAPEEGERKPASTTFTVNSDNHQETIRGWADVDGNQMHVFISNMKGYLDNATVYADGYGDMNDSWAIAMSWIPEGFLSEPLTVAFPMEDAIRQGDELIAELGFENVVCDMAYPVYFTKRGVVTDEDDGHMTKEALRNMILDTGYELQYVRCLNGFPISYTPIPGAAVPENESYKGVWYYEVITLDITKDGLVCFHWISPHTEPALKVEDTKLMPFSEIADVFGKMIMVKNSDIEYVNERNGFTTFRNFEVHNVKLSLMRIKPKDSFDKGLLVPVWDFWGTEKWTYDGWDNNGVEVDNGEEVILTINAVDGSLIDRALGY